MKKPRVSILAFLILSLVLGAVCIPVSWRRYQAWKAERRENKRMADITGSWRVVKMHGQPFDAESLPTTFVFNGDELRLKETNEVVRIKKDSSTTPCRLDVIHPDGTVVKGIYRREGDRLRIANGLVGWVRPAGFDDPDKEETVLELSQ